VDKGTSEFNRAVRQQVRSNVGGGGGRYQLTFNMASVSTLDADGVDTVLKKHATKIQKLSERTAADESAIRKVINEKTTYHRCGFHHIQSN
jgi:hypothetical protein